MPIIFAVYSFYMGTYYNKVYFLAFIFSLNSFTVWSQDSLSTLDPVVVSASLSPTQSSRTGRNIIVIAGEQIAQLPVNSVDELLRYLPGIEIQARGPMGSQSDISIRGSTFQQVLVVLDGIRLNDPLTGHFSAYIPLPASEIDRIEVLKGAASAIYGTEAVGGVIHIITKTFARKQKTNNLKAQFTGGEFGLWGVNAGAQWANDQTILSAGIISNHSNGQPQRGTNGFFDLTSISLGFSQKLNENWNLGLRSAYDSRNFSAQNYYTTFVSDTATEKITSWWNHAQLNYAKGSVTWTTDVGSKALRDQFAFNKNALPNDNKSQLFQILSRGNLKVNQKMDVTAGFQYIDRGIKSNDRGTHQVWQTAFFAMLNYHFDNGFTINPAMRFDFNERGGFEWVPQLNLSYSGEKYQVRSSLGRTIRDADFTERFNNYNRFLVTSGRIGNPDLQAESGWNYEAGIDWWVTKGLKISGTLFARNQKKLIDWVNTPYTNMPRKDNLVPTGTYALSSNIWKVNTIGWETDIQFNRKFTRDQSLQGQFGFIVLSTSGNENTPSLYLNAQATFLTNFNIQYRVKKWNFSGTGLYKSREPQKLAGSLNADLSKDYLIWNTKFAFQALKGLGIFLQIDNVTDTKYSDLLGAPMPGRWFMGGLDIALGK